MTWKCKSHIRSKETWRLSSMDEFAKATDKYTGKRIAWVIDNRLIMAPVVITRIDSGIISLDTLHWTYDELKNIYDTINSSIHR